MDILRQVEAKYPALLFKQQLTASVEKLYGMLRDNLKKEISPLLAACIQVDALFLITLIDFEIATCVTLIDNFGLNVFFFIGTKVFSGWDGEGAVSIT